MLQAATGLLRRGAGTSCLPSSPLILLHAKRHPNQTADRHSHAPGVREGGGMTEVEGRVGWGGANPSTIGGLGLADSPQKKILKVDI